MPADLRHVFINAPFDEAYEPMFVTLVGALVFFRQRPHCVLEVRESGGGRLERIFDLIQECRVSIHDLSRVSTPVRFNMPFELGLCCALKLMDPKDHEVLVLDAKAYRLDRLLSDYKGRDPLIHDGTTTGLVGCLLDAFEPKHSPQVAKVLRGVRLLRQAAEAQKRSLGSRTLFRRSVFETLLFVAESIGRDLGFSE